MADAQLDSTQLALTRTALARERTDMAAERTLMAWNRTGVSQIGLGISLFKFLEALEVKPGIRFAAVIVAIGTLSSVLGLVDYMMTNKRLNRAYGGSHRLSRYHVALASTIASFGFVMLATILAPG